MGAPPAARPARSGTVRATVALPGPPVIPAQRGPITSPRALRLDLLVGRTRLAAKDSPDPALAALVAEIAVELRSLHRSIDRDA